ncbi:rhomboid family intramembrane serine protease [Wenxinia saemankumensis]|nr:rhomboid family intramembrane serine protease [Wenxinia saemankumensis]
MHDPRNEDDRDGPAFESPFNAVPPVILAVAALAALIEAAFSLGASGLVGGPGAVGWRLAAARDYGFSPLVFDQILLGDTSLSMWQRLVTYAPIHGSFTQALFGIALLLALGKFVGEVFHWGATLILLMLTTVAGALAFGAVFDGPIALIGLYPATYGLIGAFTYLLWTRLGADGGNRLMAFRLIGVLMGLQLVFTLLFGSNPTWVADVAGFAAGFAASILLAPGGWTAFLDRMRRRT